MNYSREFKLKCIKLGECTIGDVAKKREIPKQTISRWIKEYQKNGPEGLKNKKVGAKKKKINPKIEKIVLKLWNEQKRSAYKMIRDLGKLNITKIEKGNNPKHISKREIYQIYRRHNLRVNEKRSQEIDYKR